MKRGGLKSPTARFQQSGGLAQCNIGYVLNAVLQIADEAVVLTPSVGRN